MPRTIQHPRPFWRWLVGGSAIATGIVLLGFGASAVSASSACSASMPCTVDGKTYYRDTGSLGPGLAIIGTFALLGGGALIAIPGRKEQSDLFTILYKR